MAEKLSKTDGFQALSGNLTKTVSRFIQSQIENAPKKARGRSFSLQDKVLALALFKQSPKAYRLLCNIFALPSPPLLRKLLCLIPISPGISEPIFRNLKLQAAKMRPRDRCCVLMFDEMSIQPHFHYSQHQDVVEGLVDDGCQRHLVVADHVQVFMLRGIFKKWKQPVAYRFCKSTATATDIVRWFKEVVRAAQAAGLRLIASVCDQGVTNVKAIKILKEETRGNAIRNNEEDLNNIKIDGDVVIPLFDPPHLFKSLRNNLLTKDLRYSLDGHIKTAKWSHIEDAYYIDCSGGKLRVMPKLTEFHVHPKKIKKMKVSACSQVFSRTVAAALTLMSRSGSTSVDGSRVMDAAGQDTADLCLFLDELFDSLNARLGYQTNKTLQLAVSRKSAHLKVWNRAIQVLESMQFIAKKPGDRTRPPVIDNFISTIKGFKLIQTTIKQHGYDVFPTRSFNQDPLENFFGQIRQHGVRNINPTCSAFGPFFKTLIVNNFATVYSPGSNCEKDDCHSMLIPLRELLTQGVAQSPEPENWEPPTVPENFPVASPVELAALGYVSGFIAKTVLPTFLGCDVCLSNILHEGELSAAHVFVELKEFNEITRLTYCSDQFVNYLGAVYNHVIYLLPHILHLPRVSNLINSFIIDNVHNTFKECSHLNRLVSTTTSSFCRLILHHYTNKLNKILSGRLTPSLSADILEKLAYDIYNKRRK